MKTEAEAKAAALDAGVLPEHITPEVLRAFGMEITDPTASFTARIIIPSTEEAADLAALDAEMKANSLPANIIKYVGTALNLLKAAGVAFVLVICVCLSGCSTQQAQNAEQKQATIVQGMNDQHVDFENALISDFQAKSIAHAQGVLDAAMKSATVNGAVPVDVVQGLQKQRDGLLVQIAATVQTMRAKQAVICGNMATYLAYNQAMQHYLSQKAVDFNAMAAGMQSLQDLLTSLTVKTAAKVPSP